MATTRPEKITLDATGKSFGRFASEVAHHLRGKHLPDFAPHVNPRVQVEVIHLNNVTFTGKKFRKKTSTHYSGYPGGLNERKLSEQWEKDPERVLREAVRRMLPANRLRKELLKNMIVKH